MSGAKYYISAWVNEGDDGKKYFKLSFTPADERAGDRRQQPERGGPDFGRDRIPFEMEWRG